MGKKKRYICKQCGVEFRRYSYTSGKIIKYCSIKCYADAKRIHNVVPVCLDCGDELSKPGYKYCRVCWQKGERNHNWQGGKTLTVHNTARKGSEHQLWRRRVVKKDNGLCQCCGSNNKIEAHHKLAFADIVRKYNITTLEEALQCEELWDVNNGVTLCEEHHQEFHFLYGKSGYTENDWNEWFNNRMKKTA